MVEPSATTNASERNQTTPESEKPRVQLEFKNKTNSSPVVQIVQSQKKDEEHLDLLKQTVAHLENHEGTEASQTASAAASAEVEAAATSKSEASVLEAAYQ